MARSGAGVVKGDIEFGEEDLIQCKACGKDLRVSWADLRKAQSDAVGRGKRGVVVCELESGERYWIFSENDVLSTLYGCCG